MVCLSRAFPFRFFKGCLPQILLGPYFIPYVLEKPLWLKQEKKEKEDHEIRNLPSQIAVQGCSVEKMFLKMLQNSQENTWSRVSFFNQVVGRACNFVKKEKKRLWHRCFCEVFRNTYFEGHLRPFCLKEELAQKMANK